MKEEYRSKIEYFFSRALLVCFLLVCVIVWIKIFAVGEKRAAFDLEARNAERFPELTVTSFLSGDFQEKLDLAISDNMPGCGRIRQQILNTQNSIFSQLSWIAINPNSGYRLIAKGYYTYDGYDYLVRPVSDDSIMNFTTSETEQAKQYRAIAEKSSKFYNSLPIKNKYLYIINTDREINFDNPKLVLGKKISQYFPEWKYDELEIDDFSTFRKYYYKNDHHWNYRGQYQGYKDIIRMMLGEDERLLEPLEEVTFKYRIYGSKNRLGNYNGFSEHFTAYNFDRGEYDTYINGVLGKYDAWDDYFNDKQVREGKGRIQYADFYGKDYAVVEFDFHQPQKENLLIIGFSDTNSINSLIASHFNKTWDVDPRHCSLAEFKKIIRENNIQNVLLLPYGSGFLIHNGLLMEDQSDAV